MYPNLVTDISITDEYRKLSRVKQRLLDAALAAYEFLEPMTDGAPDAPERDKEAGRIAEQLWAAIQAAE